VNSRDEAAVAALVAQITAAGGAAIAAPGDVTVEADLAVVREVVTRAWGPVQILAAFAGGRGIPVPTADLPLDQWRAIIESDLTSTFATVAAFLPDMIARGDGVIIMMSSAAGRRPSEANAAYAAAKAGVAMFSRHLANEVGRHGVRVNCLAPSAVLNDRMRQMMSGPQLEALAATFPLGRVGQPEDIAEAVLYLASNASSWVTGVTLDVTGGRVIV
jgi:3-oxoacyl-[acyl-carrier protein] reductase